MKKNKDNNKTLEIIFDSLPKIKLIRFFIRNNNNWHSSSEIGKRLKITTAKLKPALRDFEEADLIKRKKSKSKSRKEQEFSLNKHFYLMDEIRGLVLKTMPYSKEKMAEDFKKLGKVKLAVIAGVFLNAEKKRIDFLLVGDKIDNRKLKTLISNLESQIGVELEYSVMDSSEYNYRYKMVDRFIRDIFEYPHEVIINKVKKK